MVRSSSPTTVGWYQLILIYISLAAIVFAVFGQTAWFDFVNYDDGSYVFENAIIRAGLTWHGVVWPFTHIHSQNWHPLTSISHMIDCQIFGLNGRRSSADQYFAAYRRGHSVVRISSHNNGSALGQRRRRPHFRGTPAASRIRGVDRRTQRCLKRCFFHADVTCLSQIRRRSKLVANDNRRDLFVARSDVQADAGYHSARSFTPGLLAAKPKRKLCQFTD